MDSPLEYAGLESIKNNVSRYLFVVNQTLGIQTVMDVLKAEKNKLDIFLFSLKLDQILINNRLEILCF